MSRICQLPQSLVNKIAAGEVIERPASVVKELMENAVDAGATRIDVSIGSGGSELVRVVDNGSGIAPADLELAVASHATSKLASADDLFRIATLGFRGEALASIAEVSRLSIRSRLAKPRDDSEASSGAQIEVVGGKSSGVSPAGGPVGTTIEVQNLFFNTPVRRKFLRTTQTEFGHVSEAFLRIALAMPNTHFSLRHNDRQVFDLPASKSWIERIALVAGRTIADALIQVESTDGPVQLSGYVAHPAQSRSNHRMQYLFLNGRFIRDRSLQHALSEAYRGLLTSGRFPITFLALALPADLVDVNVHPTKLEVRFQDSGQLYSQLLSTLRTKFLNTDLTTRVATPVDDDPTQAHAEDRTRKVRQQVVDWAKGEVTAWNSAPSTGERSLPAPNDPPPDASSHRPLECIPLDRALPRASASDAPPEAKRCDTYPTDAELDEANRQAGNRFEETYCDETHVGQPPAEAEHTRRDHSDTTLHEATPRDRAEPIDASGGRVRAMQIHNRYLVAESDDGVMLVDQHALHERILYEQLQSRVMAGSIESQNLLVPEPVDLSPAEAAAVLEHRELLGQLGIKIEPFGGDTVLVAGYPAMLAAINPTEVLQSVLEPLLTGGRKPDRHDLLAELLHTIACKAAIKAGDQLAPEEITALLEQRHLIDNPHHCPHGRPAALVFTREELDKHFRRV